MNQEFYLPVVKLIQMRKDYVRAAFIKLFSGITKNNIICDIYISENININHTPKWPNDLTYIHFELIRLVLGVVVAIQTLYKTVIKVIEDNYSILIEIFGN